MFEGLNELERKVGGERRSLWKGSSLPLKFFVLFGLVSYIVQMWLTYHPLSLMAYAPPGSSASFVLAYSLCPLCIFTPTVDLSPATMAYFVGPIDATLHGAVGAMVGYIFEAFL
jgi:hypothetical protein